jgi:hypothetical protein
VGDDGFIICVGHDFVFAIRHNAERRQLSGAVTLTDNNLVLKFGEPNPRWGMNTASRFTEFAFRIVSKCLVAVGMSKIVSVSLCLTSKMEH